MKTIGHYEQLTELTNRDAGSCRHCIARQNGRKYFLKEFSAPRYPVDESLFSPAMTERKKRECEDFERTKKRIYESINRYSCGTAVRVEEMFRVGACYYIAMDYIQGEALTVEDISLLSLPLKRRLCATIAHAVAKLHEGGFVHADIKHSNVVFTRGTANMITVKLIDYDAGFMTDSPPEEPEDFEGDLVYYSPESCCFLVGQDVRLTYKIDIFALGVLFHQYLAGDLPEFDRSEYTCAGDAIAAGAEVKVSAELPEDLRDLLQKMLAPNPYERPEAYQVFCALRGKKDETTDGEDDTDDGEDDTEFEKDPLGEEGWHQHIPER